MKNKHYLMTQYINFHRKFCFIVLMVGILCIVAAADSLAITPIYENPLVTMSDDGHLSMQVDTNLPEKTSLDVALWQTTPTPRFVYAGVPDSYPRFIDCCVVNGSVFAKFPSVYEQGLPIGKYEIIITTTQIQAGQTLGDKNARLEGPGVRNLANGFKEHVFRIRFPIENVVVPHPKESEKKSGYW